MQSKAEEDLAKDGLADFADTENEALLEQMYQGYEDREGEIDYSERDLLLAEKLEILADREVIRENYKYLGKKRSPPVPVNIKSSPNTLRTFFDREERRNMVEGSHSEPYKDVWLAIDEGLWWMPEEGKPLAERYEWTNLALVFNFPLQNFYKKV